MSTKHLNMQLPAYVVKAATELASESSLNNEYDNRASVERAWRNLEAAIRLYGNACKNGTVNP